MTAVAAIALVVWLYLLLARGGFWRCSERDDWPATELATWPGVAAVVPARNEADCIGESIASLLAQEYRGQWTIILVDDDSSDGTGDIAQNITTVASVAQDTASGASQTMTAANDLARMAAELKQLISKFSFEAARSTSPIPVISGATARSAKPAYSNGHARA